MPITINGSGTIAGLSVGGLPDATVVGSDLAAGAAASNLPGSTIVGNVSHSGVYRYNSYLALGRGASNDDLLAWNYTPDNSGNYAPNYAGDSGAGGTLLKMPFGGGGGLDIFTRRHGTNSASTTLSSFSRRWSVDDAGRVTMPFQPAFRVSITAGTTTTLSNGNTIIIPWNREQFDRDNNFNTSTFRFTVPANGIYFFHTNLLVTKTDGSRVDIQFLKNGAVQTSREYQGIPSTSVNTIYEATEILELVAGDFISLQLTLMGNSTNGNIYTSNNELFNVFTGYLIG
jgi:hypothetical protein